MDVHPTGVKNAISLQVGSPDLYSLVSDTTSEGHKWLPSVMPDGKYKGSNSPNTPSSPTEAPVADPVSCEDVEGKFKVVVKKGKVKKKNCRWVENKRKKRCNKRTPDGERLSELCPEA